jgi:hypothetical protein
MQQSYYALGHTFNTGSSGGTRAVDIDAGGIVGIGTGSPSLDSYGNASTYKLNIFYAAPTGGTVDDILRLTSKFSSVNNAASANVGSGPAIVFAGGIGDNQTRDRARIVAVYEGNNVSGLAFHTQDAADTITEKLRVRNNGNVGIGISAPGARFHVLAPATTNMTIFDAVTNGYSYLTLRTNGTNYGYIGQASALLSGGSSTELCVRSENALLLMSNGENVRVKISGTDVAPNSDNAINLGTSSLRWANIFTADLHLSNRDSSNDIDGTWGDWTIQEGETKLYLINRRNGKKYSFVLSEEE